MNRLRIAVAVIRRDGRCFLQRREPGPAFLAGLWEFPGGKIEGGESAEEALVRELREELAWRPGRPQALQAFVHDYPGLMVELHPFLCETQGSLGTRLAWGWFLPAEIHRLPLPEASRALLDRLGLR
ncbi:MAG: NUDIX domain-containing protein [Acidobacteria bacterium]|nr:NUDIX domain-containing protein [Acidobacteriota bacterium]